MGLRLISLAAAVAAIVLAGCAAVAAAESTSPAQKQGDTLDSFEQRIMAKSLVSTGDAYRLQSVIARARDGEKIVVGVIGGSITQGASASVPDKNYGSLVAKWWRETFPTASVEFVNAGIGASGSHYGALRFTRDLGSRGPDFVIVEYGVNDLPTQDHVETYEGLLRQVLKLPNSPAAMLLFTMHNNGGNVQEQQMKLGKHYGLPMVSFRDALWPEIEAGSIQWEDIEADIVHPNDRGHAYMAQFVTAAIKKIMSMPPTDAKPIPGPLHTDAYEYTALSEGRDMAPISNDGWIFNDVEGSRRGWKSDKPGSIIEFEVSGQAVLFSEYHVNGPAGMARVQVDNRPAEIVDAWYDQTWGGWRNTHVLAKDLKPGKHRVRVELLEEKNPRSTGNEFIVSGLGAAGVKPPDNKP